MQRGWNRWIVVLGAAACWGISTASVLAQDCEGVECEGAECASDADCPQSFRCRGVRYLECPDDFDDTCLKDDPGLECELAVDARVESECEEVEHMQCRGNWRGICESDDDCGEGFVCEPPGACQPIDDDCETDDDCPGAWQCRLVQEYPCDGDTGTEDPNPCGAPQVMRCEPPVDGTGMGTDGSSSPDDVTGDDDFTGQSGSEQALAPMESGGCAVTRHPSRPPAAFWSALVAVGLLLVRRRSRQCSDSAESSFAARARSRRWNRAVKQ